MCVFHTRLGEPESLTDDQLLVCDEEGADEAEEQILEYGEDYERQKSRRKRLAWLWMRFSQAGAWAAGYSSP